MLRGENLHHRRTPAAERQGAQPMTNRNIWGTVVTVAWLICIGALLFTKWDEARQLSLNSLGDFMAGAFAPLAFMWLVLGYMQQGEELRLSTEALKLQAAELRNSVEQQRDLVEVTRQQVESDREAMQYERDQRIEASKPKLLVSSAGFMQGPNGIIHPINVSNAGNIASNFKGHIDGYGERILCFDSPLFAQGSMLSFGLNTGNDFPVPAARLTFVFNDALGSPGERVFRIVKQVPGDAVSSLSFEQIT